MKTMKKNILLSKLALAIGMFVFSLCAFSQTNTDTIIEKTNNISIAEAPTKLKFGCGFGLNFVGGTNISLSPNLTFRVNEKIFVTGGIQGSYAAIKNIQSTITYGASILGQFNPSKKILTTLEFTQLRVSTNTVAGDITKNYWDSALFIGAGLNVTNKISVGVKYNLLYKEGVSIYTSPIIPFVNITF